MYNKNAKIHYGGHSMNTVIFRYPNWVRKSITFTIDDGNVPLDRKFISITRPAGIKGTFNLCTPLRHFQDPEDYRAFYEGYEIGNHCRYHAYPFSLSRPVTLKNELFPGKDLADEQFGYHENEPGLYRIHTYAWTYMADDDKYMALVDSCQKELEEVFGKDRVKGYIWPCGEQNNPEVFKRLVSYGFQSIRAVGNVKDSTNFDLPANRMRWSYNADNRCLNEVAALYDAYPDDGKLKFFCFGVHSHDFENDGNWNELVEFAERFGEREQDFWYASVGEIFDYEDAVKSARVSGTAVSNPSKLDLYAEIDGEKVVIPAGGTYAK